MFHSALRFVDQIARHGSIRKAAEHLHISASAVNRQLLQLEDELSVPLFERLPRGMRPTAAGEILLANIRRWDGETASIRLQLQNLTGGARGTIRIIAPELTADTLLPDAMRDVQERFPQVGFSLTTSDTLGVINTLLAKEADVGLAFNARVGSRLRVVATVQPSFGAVMAPNHPLAHRPQVTLLECASYPLVLPSEDWGNHTLTLSTFAAMGGIRVAARSGRAGALRAFAKAGLGITFLARLEVESDLRSGQLALVPLADPNLRGATLSLFVPLSQASAGVTAVFIQKLQHGMRQTHQPLRNDE